MLEGGEEGVEVGQSPDLFTSNSCNASALRCKRALQTLRWGDDCDLLKPRFADHAFHSVGGRSLKEPLSDRELRGPKLNWPWAHLCELHFSQPMVQQAPLVLIFCADSFRTRQWLAQRGARLNFGNLISWHVASFDAIILAQTTALALQSHGLGICYMGTPLHRMRAIADFLDLPEHCLPATSLVVGWPAEAPAPRDRLPPPAWIHDETYQRPSVGEIDQHSSAREVKGWARYRSMGLHRVDKMEGLGILMACGMGACRGVAKSGTFGFGRIAARRRPRHSPERAKVPRTIAACTSRRSTAP